MRKLVSAMGALTLSIASPVQAQATGSALGGLSFLVGAWQAGQGQVADTGEASKGRSVVTLEAGGNVLLRRDHTDLFSRNGKPTHSFEQIMMIYPEGDTLHADYSDGQHVIHYAKAAVVAGRAVTFTTSIQPNAPAFRLTYNLVDPRTLSVAFEMAPPGTVVFHPVATGRLTKG